MVAEAATTRVSLLRGIVYDAYGDVQDAGSPVDTGLPAILIETAQSVFDPATQLPRTVRTATCRVAAWAGVLVSDQILDEVTGNIYAVEDITTPPTTISGPAGGAPDTVLTLRRITAATT